MGTQEAMRKKLYYANRLQLAHNLFMQPIFAYSIVKREERQHELMLVTNIKFKKLSTLLHR